MTRERDSDYVDVTITCTVWDRAALWRKARDYLIEANSMDEGATEDSVIGSESAPHVGACLIMLLDRSEHLDGADIEGSETDWQSDDNEEDGQ